jgi:hypothetical protein
MYSNLDIRNNNLAKYCRRVTFLIASGQFTLWEQVVASLSLCMSGLVLFGIKAMPHNQNTSIERDSFDRFN